MFFYLIFFELLRQKDSFCAAKNECSFNISTYRSPIFNMQFGIIFFLHHHRELQRLESISISPILSHFAETVEGMFIAKVLNPF